jgi:hypothetical protein
MDEGDGMFTVELQAKKMVDNLTTYNGSRPCPACGTVMNPVEFMAGKGLCTSCSVKKNQDRVKNMMA